MDTHKTKSKIFKFIKIVLLSILFLVVLLVLVYSFVLRPHKLNGRSMSPNFLNGEYMLSEKISYYFGKPKRGDVVIFRREADVNSIEYIARIVGLPGESVSIRGNGFYIDGDFFNEPYLDSNIKTVPGNYINEKDKFIPAGYYAILGDNRIHSNDSKDYGFVSEENIKSRVFYVYWPDNKHGFVKNPLVYN